MFLNMIKLIYMLWRKDMAKKMVARNIPTKNYYMVLLVSVLLIILTIYVRNMYLSYRITRINDSVFAESDYYKHIAWLKNEQSDLYDPEYSDVLQTVFRIS